MRSLYEKNTTKSLNEIILFHGVREWYVHVVHNAIVKLAKRYVDLFLT